MPLAKKVSCVDDAPSGTYFSLLGFVAAYLVILNLVLRMNSFISKITYLFRLWFSILLNILSVQSQNFCQFYYASIHLSMGWYVCKYLCSKKSQKERTR